jgi:hypothetical protein
MGTVMDPEEFEPDELQQLVEAFRVAKLEMEAKTRQLVSWIVQGDEDPEPIDQNVVQAVAEDMMDLENMLEDAQQLISPDKIEIEEMPYLLNPPGYPVGTRRYRPLTRVQVNEILCRGCWVTSEIDQVEAREGTILWVRPDPDWYPIWEAGEQDGVVQAPWAPVKAPVQAKAPPLPTVLDDEEFDLEGLDDPMPAKLKQTGLRKEDRFRMKKKL